MSDCHSRDLRIAWTSPDKAARDKRIAHGLCRGRFLHADLDDQGTHVSTSLTYDPNSTAK
jgi:hypothetical protein